MPQIHVQPSQLNTKAVAQLHTREEKEGTRGVGKRGRRTGEERQLKKISRGKKNKKIEKEREIATNVLKLVLSGAKIRKG